MSFDNVGQFLYMGGHYMEVWLSYAAGLVVVTGVVARPFVTRRRFFKQERRRLERDSAARPSTGAARSSTGEGDASRAS